MHRGAQKSLTETATRGGSSLPTCVCASRGREDGGAAWKHQWEQNSHGLPRGGGPGSKGAWVKKQGRTELDMGREIIRNTKHTGFATSGQGRLHPDWPLIATSVAPTRNHLLDNPGTIYTLAAFLPDPMPRSRKGHIASSSVCVQYR